VTERDKMLRGELYDARDPALVAARLAARRLTPQLDLLDPGDVTDRDRLLRELLGDIGAGSWVESPFFCDYGSQIHLGDRVFVNMGCVFLDAAPITLGADVIVGAGSVVTRSLSTGVVAAGNPCRVISRR
jgi:maltose O-acetyltransferase